MNVDELLADPLAAFELPPDAYPNHAIVIVDYTDAETGARFLTATTDDALPSWALRGALIEAYDLIQAVNPYVIDTGSDGDD